MSVIRAGKVAWRRWSGQFLEERDPYRDRREQLLLLAGLIFIFINSVAFSLVSESAIRWTHLYAPLVWTGVVIMAHVTIRTFQPRRDPYLLPIFALLAGWGLLLQDRLAPNFLGRQTLWFTLATIALLVVAVLPRTLQPLMRYRYSLLAGGLVLLAITLLFGVNPSGSGAALWLPVPFPLWGTVYFQPSELLKLLLVIFLASYFTEQEPMYRYRKQIARENENESGWSLAAMRRHLPFLGPLFLMWGFTLLLLVWQQDLGAAALFFIVFVAMLYLATGEWIYVWSGIFLLFLAGLLAFFAFDTVVAPRVLSWLNPWPNVSDRAYQIVQALYAQAAGGVFGQGIGQGYPDFIPVVHSDFALAAVSEEWGLIGSLTIVACFATLSIRGLRAAISLLRGNKPRFFYAYLGAGLVALFSVQTFLIMGGNTRLLPLTGITLPFVSYGGSSLLVSSLAIGLLLFLSAAAEPPPPSPPADPKLARRIERLGLGILAVFSVIAVVLTYWSIIRADALLAREDNPRLIEVERRVERGNILDRRDRVLAESTGPTNNFTRIYPVPEISPVVGYYSLRFGTAGVENSFDNFLRGQSQNVLSETVRQLLHLPLSGGDIRLTLDAELQQTATKLMSTAGTTGGLVLLELTEINGEPVAEIRTMASLPGYDPNTIDQDYEALSALEPGPLVNRAAQALYQPGLVLQSPIIASSADSGFLLMDDPLVDPFLPVTIHDQVLRCAQPHDEADLTLYRWSDMGLLRCPSPVKTLGDYLGKDALTSIFTQFGLNQAPAVPIPTHHNRAVIADPGMAAIGQDALTISPLHAALVTATLAKDGRVPGLRLVEALSAPGDAWETQPAGTLPYTQAAVSPEMARAVRAGWPVVDGVASFAVIVLAGPDDSRNAWFLGMIPSSNPRYVLAMVLEGQAKTSVIEEIGRKVLMLADSTGNGGE